MDDDRFFDLDEYANHCKPTWQDNYCTFLRTSHGLTKYPLNIFETTGTSPDSDLSSETIAKKRRELALWFHPDKHPGQDTRLEYDRCMEACDALLLYRTENPRRNRHKQVVAVYTRKILDEAGTDFHLIPNFKDILIEAYRQVI